MATTSRPNIRSKFENNDIPTQEHFGQIIESFVHKDDKADFQMVEIGTDNEHYITPALLNVGLQNIGIITGNSYMPKKEYFDISLTGVTTVSLEEFPIPNSVRVYKNGQLLQEGEDEGQDYDYKVNYNTAIITFSGVVSDRNIEVDYWFKNLNPAPGNGGGESEPVDLTNFLHTTGNETKNGILTFNNTTAASTSGIALSNSGSGATSASLNITVSGAGKGISVENSSTGTGVYLNSTAEATGDILQVAKNNVVKVKIDNDGVVTAKKYISEGGTDSKFVKGDGSLDPKVYAEDSKALHTTGEELKDGALTLTNSLPQDVLTINKNDDANCLKLVQNSNSDATTSTWDTSTDIAGRKAISIEKLGDPTAFITHDGDISGLSFSTPMASLTDNGWLALENGDAPESSEGKAKLYAKSDGTDTHMYVKGSDGIEKKIGGDVDLSDKEDSIIPGTTAQYYRGDKSWQTLDKSTIGLNNTDNTSDLNKPVSTATQTALNLKANLSSPIFTGTPQLPTGTIATTQTLGDNSTKIATTAFLNNSLAGTLKIAGGITTSSHQSKVSDPNGNASRLRLSTNWVTNYGAGDVATNTVFGIANQNNTTGFQNSSFGSATATFNTTGGENVSVGYNAGTWANNIFTVANTITNQSVYIGANTTSFSNNQTNQIVIGYNANGAGSNTVTLGNSLITNTILRGEVSANSYKINTVNSAPATATSPGTTGEIRFTTTGIFICIATNTWIKCVGTTF